MNTKAARHLDRAVGYIEKGDEFYRKAALEIEAAMQADPELTYAEIGKLLGKSHHYPRRLLAALSRARETGEPFSVDWESGSNKREEVAKKHLAEAEPEEVAALVGEALQRDDVIEHLASDDEAMDKVVGGASKALNREAKKRGIDYDKDRKIESDSPTMFDKMKARAEIHLHLVQAVELAIEHNLEDFILEFLEDSREKVEMSLAAGNPKKAVEELEAWLHEQPEAEEV